MNAEPILVTGASGGKQGATGNHIVRMLTEHDLPVRAFVHKIDERSEQLKSLGVEVVVGDFLNIESVRKAMQETRRAYFAYPVQDGLLDATAIFAAAGKEAGLELLVNNGHLNTSADNPRPRTRQHWLSEQVFNWSGISTVHLRCAVFYENLRAMVAESVAAEGKMYLPSGAGEELIPMVAGEDVARVAAAILADPDQHAGQTHFISGPPQTLQDVAASFTSILNRPVEYVEIPLEEFRQALTKRMPDNPLVVAHLSILWGDVLKNHREAQLAEYGRQPGGLQNLPVAVQQIGGNPPKPLEQFIGENAEAFGGIRA